MTGKFVISAEPDAQAVALAAPLVEVIEALPCGALVVADDGRILFANARVGELLGRPAHDLAGRLLVEFGPAGDPPPAALARLISATEPFDTELELPHADGGRVSVLASVRPTAVGSGMSGQRIVTLVSVAGLKEAQDQLREQYRQIARLSDTVLEQALDLKGYSKSLEKRVAQRTRELHEANLEAIYMLAVASEAKDEDTGAHVLRIRDYSRLLAAASGLPEAEAERIGYSAILHDVGKMQVPDAILKKPGSLTPDERRVIETHTLAGERILSDKPFFLLARQIARSHQENWDGSGYPDRLGGEQIPLAARIVRLADVFDALVSRRVYKPAWPLDRVVETIRQGAGREFDPELVAAFLKLLEAGEWLAVGRGHGTDDNEATL
ncbi:MAG: HD domain-containing protein [Phycisphaerales bacterium]|nr:HD domain-containing protein [Phycisphaerales bacterium]